jgi:hypothetical protein
VGLKGFKGLADPGLGGKEIGRIERGIADPNNPKNPTNPGSDIT